MQGLEKSFIRRNYALGVANGALFYLSALGLMNATIVIPPFIYQLASRGGVAEGWGKIMVGLVVALMTVGWLWPQLIFSNIIETFERKKPFYVVSGLLRIAIFGALPLGVFLFAVSHPLILFSIIAVSLFLYSSFGGVGLLPFMDIVSRSMPADMRGRFFGARAFWGSSLAFIGGIFVKRILNPETGPGYPNNYLMLFLLAWAAMASAVFAFSIAKEPPGRPRRVRITFLQQIWRGPKLLSRDRDFSRILIARGLLGLCGIAAPFYILYARERMKVGDDAAGIFVACEVLFTGLAALVSGRIGDTFGNKVLMTVSAVGSLLTPVVALSTKAFSFSQSSMLFGVRLDVWVFCGVFAFAGFAQTGSNMAALNYLLDIAPERRRPTYLGIMYTASAPLTFVPVLGGALAGWISYEFVFFLAALFGFLLIVSALRLREPRGAAAAATSAFIGVPFLRPVRWIAGKLKPRR